MEVWIQVIAGGGGLFALVRYIISENSKSQRVFLEHLEKKNGHMERISDRFNATTLEFQKAMEKVSVSIEKLSGKVDGVATCAYCGLPADKCHH